MVILVNVDYHMILVNGEQKYVLQQRKLTIIPNNTYEDITVKFKQYESGKESELFYIYFQSLGHLYR